MYRNLLLIGFLLLAGCSGPALENHRSASPTLLPQTFFNGNLTAHGIVKDRSGRVIRTFNAELVGSWSDTKGLLKERFVFDDAQVQLRNWQLIPTHNDHRTFIGRAEDVVGDARIRGAGNAMFINYTLRIPYRGDTIDVAVDDRMYLISDRVLINESRLSKWGVDLGEVVLTIIKH